MYYGGPVVFLKGDMPMGYESAARGPIFGRAPMAFYYISKHHTIQNIGPHHHSGIHIALQVNDRTGVNRRQCCTL